MHKIECVIELIISAVAILGTLTLVVPDLRDLPAPSDIKIELISRPSHD